jgi:plastocyanin
VRLNPPGHAKTRSLTILSALTLAVGPFALAGCGSSSSSTTTSATTPTTTAANTATSSTPAPASAAGSQKLSLEANPEGQLKYNKSSLTAKAGTVSISFSNMSPLSHNLTLESPSGTKLGATPTFKGGSQTLALSLKPGTYKFFCTVPGHRAAGMEGTLTVQ